MAPRAGAGNRWDSNIENHHETARESLLGKRPASDRQRSKWPGSESQMDGGPRRLDWGDREKWGEIGCGRGWAAEAGSE